MPTPQETKEALDRAVQSVTLRPSRGQRTYVNAAIIEGGTECRVEEAGHMLTVDVGPGIGGSDMGPTPSMLVRSALSSCIAIGIKLWAAREQVPIDHVSVILETDADARGFLGVSDDIAPGFTATRIKVSVVSPAPRADVDRIITTSLQYSSLIDIFENEQTVIIETDLDRSRQVA